MCSSTHPSAIYIIHSPSDETGIVTEKESNHIGYFNRFSSSLLGSDLKSSLHILRVFTLRHWSINRPWEQLVLASRVLTVILLIAYLAPRNSLESSDSPSLPFEIAQLQQPLWRSKLRCPAHRIVRTRSPLTPA